jgi:trehalose/maltose hydrolase-like predicted phosphorylase
MSDAPPFWRTAIAGCLLTALAAVPVASASALPRSAAADDGWVLTTHRFSNDFTAAPYVGNGYVGQRIPAAGTGSYRGTQGWNTWPTFSPRTTTGIVSGVYGRTVDFQGIGKQAIATIPNWTTLNFAAPSGAYGPDTATAQNIGDYEQSLDLRTGTVTTSGEWTAPGGQRARFRYRVFTDRASAHLGIVELRLTPLWSGPASVTGRIDGTGAQRLTPQTATAGTTSHTAAVGLVSTGVGTPVAEVQALHLPSGLKPTADTGAAEPSRATVSERVSFSAVAGRTYTFVKYAAIVSGRDSDDPLPTALREARDARETGLPALEQANAAAWRSVYSSDIVVTGAPGLQQVVHASEYSLYASLRADSPSAVGPSGLGGEGYGGLVFWDADTWMFPTLLLQHPDIARVIPEYRWSSLPAARRNAAEYRYSGALYPWTSGSDGDYDTNCYGGSCAEELHLQGDIALSFWQYYQATQDTAWLRSRGWPVLSELASFWASKAVRAGGGYAITGVQPPDELQSKVDNSSYTNAVAALALRHAADAARVLGIAPPAAWETLAEGLVAAMPFNKLRQIYDEYDGYRGDTIKQADVAMLTYPLGLPLPSGVAVNDLDYYAARTSPQGPAMSDAIHSIDSSQLDVAGCSAYTYLLRSYEPYIRSPYLQFSEVRAPDLLSSFSFLTGASGFLQTFLYGFTGFRGDNGSIRLDPSLPPQFPGLTLRRLSWDGRTFTIDITPQHTTVTLLSGRLLPVTGPSGRRLVSTGTPLTLPTRRPADRPTSDLARCRPATASSSASGNDPVAAVDGSGATSWRPLNAASAPWLQVDLGRPTAIGGVTVRQSTAYSYRVEVSADATAWHPVAGTTTARYVRLVFPEPTFFDQLIGAVPVVSSLEIT